jgi:hypothetical protein
MTHGKIMRENYRLGNYFCFNFLISLSSCYFFLQTLLQEYLLTADTHEREAITHAAIFYMEYFRAFLLWILIPLFSYCHSYYLKYLKITISFRVKSLVWKIVRLALCPTSSMKDHTFSAISQRFFPVYSQLHFVHAGCLRYPQPLVAWSLRDRARLSTEIGRRGWGKMMYFPMKKESPGRLVRGCTERAPKHVGLNRWHDVLLYPYWLHCFSPYWRTGWGH